jgi:multidrug resistance efflux pump
MGVSDISKSISDASIVAPFDGQLLNFSVVEGQNEDAYKNVAVVADISKLEISADIPSTSLSNWPKECLFRLPI